MKRLTCCASVLLLVTAAAAVQAETKFDAAARAKTIAPFVEEETAVVVHIDLSRIPPQPMFDFLHQVRLAAPLEMWKRQTDGFQQAGVKEIYLIAPPGIFSGSQPQMLMAAPVSSSEQEKALRAALRLRAEEGRMVGNVLVIGRSAEKEFQPVERAELTAAFEASGDTAVQVILIPPADTERVVDELWPQWPPQLGGGPTSVMTRGIRWAAAGIDVSPHKGLRLVIKSADAPAAEALRAKLVDLLRLAGQQAEVRQYVPEFDAVAALLTPRVEGDRVTVVSDEHHETFAKAVAALARPLLEAQARATSMNSLKTIALGMLNYYFANKHFPLPASRGPDGKPLLSWRVYILPHMGQSSLFKEFHLDESWDSPHNRTLIDKMPEVYRLSISTTEPGRTNYLLPVGNGAVFDADKTTELKDIRDGTSNTIMVVAVDNQHAAIWTKPDDWPFDPKDPAKGLGRFFAGSFTTAFCDGSAHWLAWPETPKQIRNLRALFTRAGGEAIEW